MTTRTRTTKILNSVNGQLTRFVTQMWLEEDKLNWLLNFLAPGMVYLVLVFVINRFWVATAVFAIGSARTLAHFGLRPSLWR